MSNQNTKDLILEKATDLFYRFGYTKTPIRKITENLGVKNTLIYYYFQGKDHLLYAIIEKIADDLIGGLKEIIGRTSDPLERLQEMIYFHMTILERKKKPVKVFVEDNDKLPLEMRLKIKEKQRRIYDLYSREFQALVKAGKARKVEIPLITFTLLGMINWTYRWYREEGTMALGDVARKTIDILFSGILLEKATSAPKKKSGKKATSRR